MKITEDGIYHLDKHATAKSIVYISGSLGGGTATLGYGSGDGVEPLLDGAVAVGEQYQVDHGMNMQIYLTLEGSSGADLNVQCKGFD